MLNYRVKEFSEAHKKIFKQLVSEGYPLLTAKCLALRNFSRANAMISPSLLTDINQAVDYLFDSILKQKKICIVADYDVDGATSCSIMFKGLQKMGGSNNIFYFVPNRFKHGYGLQASVIDDLMEKYNHNIDLIVTVDNGIASVEGAEYAYQKGIDLLITDHHLEGESRPDKTVALVNPNRKDCPFPDKALAGCGVAFYVIKALSDKFKSTNAESFSEQEQKLISQAQKFNPESLYDYLAIGTVADVVSLTENNRLLVSLGLEKIHLGKASVGVGALIDALNLKHEKLNSTHIAFSIAPTLNAAGRIEDMGKGIELLLSDDYSDAINKAYELIEINSTRKAIEKEMKENALAQLGLNDTLTNFSGNDNDFSAVVFSDNYHEGVIGILASRIKELLYVPSIVFSEVEGGELLKGSGRSIEEIHLRDAIDFVAKKTKNCVVKFGGHSMAAGLTIKKDQLDIFKEKFDEYCRTILNHQKPEQIIEIDGELNFGLINIQDVENLNSQIWGQHFKEPLFYGRFDIIEQKILKGSHLKLVLEQNGNKVEAMYFFHNSIFETDEIEAIFTLNVNDFYEDNKKIQIFIRNAETL